MKLENFTKYLTNSAKEADIVLAKEVKNSLRSFVDELKENAPVDSGKFKDAWEYDISSSGKGLMATVSNDTVYASAIEFGSTPGQKPWPSPGPKTVVSGGRIYSSQAVGGTIEKTFNDANMQKFAEKIANAILRAFK